MARPRAADYDDHRAQILKSAAALFAQRGYSAATMAELAAASGVSKPTLYHYFQDKQALLLDIAASHVARLEALVRACEGASGAHDVGAEAPQQDAGTSQSLRTASVGALAAARPWNRAQHASEHGCAAGGLSSGADLPDTLRRAAGHHRLRALIDSFMQAYADARDEHRVLTEDVKFLDPVAREAVLDAQRRVVAGFADAVGCCRPDLPAAMHKPLAMLLFGMINWTFTWLQPGGPLTHQTLGPVVADLFFGGVDAVQAPDAPRPSAGGRYQA
jgi:TetR/AcrR family transcriptional regulator